ncbi:MAG: sulfite exporter TauE/SafE family protein [Acidimicrobiia bacterium]|nr:sulfite exporter TauE/SafE family protein [Acidimicrobiia bacterium]MDH4366290.1 sulfite exporter TauE/SafE family protein [Acidimicrobiia bacterium]MDH5288541.1 sulfite exporter TauE/SafE family protein [Acidimicrobiia bacterium]
MRSLFASPLGFLIGLSLGALGGGGSILAVPALVYAAGQTPKHATTTSLVLVSVTSVFGILPHWKAGRVRFASGTIFGLAGVGGSLLGSHWNKAVNPDALLLAFSGVMLVAAAAMWRRTRATVGPTAAGAGTGVALNSLGAAASAVDPLDVLPDDGPAAGAPRRFDAITVAKVLVAGTIVGLLTGFFGVGGGFVIVPALVLALRFDMAEAVGTSLLVITINSAVALATRLQSGSIEWGTVVPFTIASLIGVVVGTRLAATRNPRSLQQWFVGLLVLVAIYTAVRSGLALA